MAGSAYEHIRSTAKRARKANPELRLTRLAQWRRQPVVQRVDRPSRLDRARALGYRAKPGITVVRTRIRRGGRRKERHSRRRKPSKAGVNKYTPTRNLRAIAEARVNRHHPNMEVLNSYWVGEDGRHKFFEVILVDPHHPAIRKDKDLKWIADSAHTSRAHRGLTGAGKEHRGLRRKGKGAEKVRPSVRANDSRTN